MTLTNHLLAGSLIAKYLPLPIAIPVAFASHFVLDALPHFGFKTIDERLEQKDSVLLKTMILLDVLVALIFATWLIYNNHLSWLLVGLVAFSPDFIWIYRFIFQENFGKLRPRPGGRFIQFHAGLQKREFPRGWVVEMIVACGLFVLVH